MGLTVFGGNTIPTRTQTISDVKTESALIHTGLCAFGGIIVRTNRIKNVIVNIYDGTDNTGRLISLPDMVLKRKASNDIWTLSYDPAIECTMGIYIELTIPTGGAVHYQVVYEEG